MANLPVVLLSLLFPIDDPENIQVYSDVTPHVTPKCCPDMVTMGAGV